MEYYFHNCIAAFHEKFGIGYSGEVERHLDAELRDFRIKFLNEEFDEYVEAYSKRDLEKQFDGLIDLMYVTVGTLYLHGQAYRERSIVTGYFGPPRELDDTLAQYHMRQMALYIKKYESATDAGYLDGKLDALQELGQCVLETAAAHGFAFNLGWLRVHSANMKKVRAERDDTRGHRDTQFDIVKPEGWVPAKLTDLVFPN